MDTKQSSDLTPEPDLREHRRLIIRAQVRTAKRQVEQMAATTDRMAVLVDSMAARVERIESGMRRVEDRLIEIAAAAIR